MKEDKTQGKFSSERNGCKSDPVRITINMTPGPASPARKQAWRKFWAKLIAEAKQVATRNDSSSD